MKFSARKASEVEKPPTVEAQHVEVIQPRAEPLSFLTLETVEGIVRNTDIANLEEYETWERRMKKFVSLGDAYSSVNTHTGEKCYMVDAALYRDILLAVAARKQNERSLAMAAEKLEQHMEQIGNSNERIMKGESDVVARMSQRMNKNFDELQEEHNTRMKNVMADIRKLNASMAVSAGHGSGPREMQRLRFQVERYDRIFPVYQAQIKDMKEQNKKLRADLLGEKHRSDQLTIRLEKSEALVITLGISSSVKRRRTVEQEHKDDGSGQESSSDDDEDEDGGEDEDDDEKEQSSSSSDDEQGRAGAQSGADQNMEASPDLNAPRTDPGKTDKGKDTAAPAFRSSYRDEALEAPKEHHTQDATMDTSSGTEAAPTRSKLLTLSSLNNKKRDSDNKRTRSSAAQLSDQEQPSNKRPPSAMSVTAHAAQNMMLDARELPTAKARSSAVLSAPLLRRAARAIRRRRKLSKKRSDDRHRMFGG